MEPTAFEIDYLRRDERQIEIGCRVFDAAAQYFASRPLTIEVMRAAVAEIVPRFEGQLPGMMVASLVGKQYAVEQERRRIAAVFWKRQRQSLRWWRLPMST